MSQDELLSPSRVLVTGAGGPAAIAVIRALESDPTVTLLAADMDPWASGLYLVDRSDALIVPAGDAEDFVDVVLSECIDRGVDLLVPTVDVELLPLARSADRFSDHGIRLLLPSARSLEIALNKLTLAKVCTGVVRVPRTELAESTDLSSWTYPVIVKPKSGSGSRGIALVHSAEEVEARLPDADLLVQEHLPGEEYSVDVVADHLGRVRAAVPRVRQRVDSGVSVAGYTLNDPELERFARHVVEVVGLPFVSNVQIRRDAEGRPSLLEVNPRVPGSLAHTVASGVDMAKIAIDSLRGRPITQDVRHRQVAMVRMLADLVVEVDALVGDQVAIGGIEA